MRSLQLFCLLHPAPEKDASIVSVDASQAVAAKRCADAIAFMEPFGFRTQAHPIKSDAAPAEAITSTAKAMDASLVVMGAYGHNPLRRFFLGSTTHKLLVESEVPLFIHH
jgi:nucleotide-binding universal stress UspA family protein